MAIIKARLVEEYVGQVRRSDFETEELFNYVLHRINETCRYALEVESE